MKLNLSKSAYKLYINPSSGGLLMVFVPHRCVAERCGYIEAPDFPFSTKEEEDMFAMLYPSIDVSQLEAVLAAWQSHNSRLNMHFYTINDLERQNLAQQMWRL